MMKKGIYLLAFSLCFWMGNAAAQIIQINVNETFKKGELTVEDLKQQKDWIEQDEKEKLRKEVEEINKQRKAGEITESEMNRLKKEAATKRAKNIEDQHKILDASIALLERNGENSDMNVYYKGPRKIEMAMKNDSIKGRMRKKKRTSSAPTVAFGFNNAVEDGQSIDDSPYKIGRSGFFHLGYEFQTKIVKSGFFRVNYGLEFQSNGLHLSDNRYFVRDEGVTLLEEHDYNLKKAVFRRYNLVLPVMLEIGPKRKKMNMSKFKFGLGGYVGFNLTTNQKIKYKHEGQNTRMKTVDNFNTKSIIYGLTGQIGYSWASLFVKYELSPIFKSNPKNEHNVAVGLRFSF